MKKKLSHAKIALVYDWVNTPHGGAEHVLLALHQLFPNAPLYTSVYIPQNAPWAKMFTVKASFLQKLPVIRRHHRILLPFLSIAFRSLDLSAYDIVISITSGPAKAVKVSPETLHLCYLLTPTRYLWSHTQEYVKGSFSLAELFLFSQERAKDFQAAQTPQHLIPISHLVRQRAYKFYRRLTLPPIYPPVEMTAHTIPSARGSTDSAPFFLTVSRLVSYKRIDLAIQACQLAEVPLYIVGDGPDDRRLCRLADRPDMIHFLGKVAPDKLAQLYDTAQALIMPAEEDFGITALEALASGCPVITFCHSGAAEVVKANITGVHVSSQTPLAFAQAISSLKRANFDPLVLQSHARRYNTAAFLKQFQKTVERCWNEFQPHT